MKKIALVLGLVAAAVGCSSAHEHEAETPADTAASNDPVERFSTDGLTVEHSDKNHVDGVFTRDSATVKFDISRDGDVRHMVLKSANGDPLVDSTLADGIDTAIYFGGKGKAVGHPNEEPKLEGDDAVFKALATSEARIFPELKEALYAAKVNRSLFLPVEGETPGGVKPDMYAWSDGRYVWEVINYLETWGFWSWSGWGWTTLIVGNGGLSGAWGDIDWNAFNYGYVQARVQAGCCAVEQMSGNGSQAISRQWWGAYIYVQNTIPMQQQICFWKQTATQCTADWSGTHCSPVWTWTCQGAGWPKLIARKY